MYATLSKNIEGVEYKEDVCRNEMFSAKTDGPFLKVGNVLFGAHSLNNFKIEDSFLDAGANSTPEANNIDQYLQEPTIDFNSVNHIEDIKQTVQTGAGKPTTSNSASKSKPKTKKKSQSKSTNTKKANTKTKKSTQKKKNYPDKNYT